ncbi:MAG: DNA primase [Caulobacteraceae bacterium]
MRFDDRFLDEIRSRLRPSDVIGKTVKLRRQGREYAGLSPFTKEKTPSFFVNDEKGFYHCFSSGKHGDIFSFLQETERLSFPEAVERLAGVAGVPMPVQDARSIEQDKQRSTLQDWLETAAAWFEGELKRPSGQAARAYLEKRKLPTDDWKRFRLGYAPSSRTALKDYLVSKGAKPAELVQAGLLIQPEDGGAPYDRFRDRIMFPITDLRGKVISFGGRALDPEAKAKYLNGPETELFNKSHVLYGLYDARKILGAGNADAPLVVVEGYMDVIACQRAGVAAVAGMGTALTEDQMALMWRFHPEPTLCFDGDGAGQRAAARAVERALPILQPNRTFKFAIVTGGKDPDDVLREQGAAALKSQLGQTIPFVEALFKLERDAEPLDTPERKTSLKARLRARAAAIADRDLALAYRDDLLGRFQALWPNEKPVYSVGAAASALSRHGWDKRRKAALAGATAEGKSAALKLHASVRPMSAALLLAAIRDPDILEGKIETLMTQSLGDERLDILARELISLRLETDSIDATLVRKRLASKGLDADLSRLENNAARAGVSAPFLRSVAAPEIIRALWSQAFDLLLDLEALERAVEQAKQDMEIDRDSSTLMTLKVRRDTLRRRLDTGSWTEDTPSLQIH